jgi:alginate O-acetyltransferase complex protein AlgJ
MPTATPSSAAPRPDAWRLPPWAERVLVAAVAVALLAPGLGTLAKLDDDRQRDDSTEGVRPADPALSSPLSLTALARQFEAGFAFRARLVRWQATLRYSLLGVSPLPTVVLGRAGWWYYADDGAVEDATRATPFTDAELETWRATLQHNADWLAARGIAYVFVLAPDKHTIYPEFLPTTMSRGHGRISRTDQLVDMLQARSTVRVVDLRRPLLDATAGARIYHRTDSHWNDLGAAIAYRQILTAVRAQAPAVPAAWPDAAFGRRPSEVPGLDLAEMAGLAGVTTETDLALVPLVPRRARVVEPANPNPQFIGPRLVTAVDDPALPRALVYRDSFGSALVPFLAEHFSRAVILWEYDVLPDTVRTERPEVVIHEWAGRRLHTRLPYDAVAADPAALDDVAANSSRAGRR